MTLRSSVVGTQGPPVHQDLDDRWLMNYAASVLDRNPVYFDTTAASLPAHPAYISQLEWQAIVELHAVMEGLEPVERLRGVHSFTDTQLFRPYRSGDRITSTASAVAVDQRRAGGRLTVRIDSVDATGALVSTSVTSSIYRGVAVEGGDAGVVPTSPLGVEWLRLPDVEPSRVQVLPVDAVAAHVFSECARDYNPIHTDVAVAHQAGLPGLVLHGTGTLAMVLSALTNHEGRGDPRRVRRFSGRLKTMVLCPSDLHLTVYPHGTDTGACRYEVLRADGEVAIADGYVEVGDATV